MAKTIVEKLSQKNTFDNLKRLKHWGIKGGLAVLDQGVYSGSNFAFNVLLARWLSAENYGAFALAFSIFLFFTGIHNAMLLEPMSVFGTAKYSEDIHNYLSIQFIIHSIVTGSAGLFIFLTGGMIFYLSLTNSFLSLSIIGVGLFLPLLLLTWIARRIFYILGEPGWALFLSAFYSFILLGGAFYLHARNSENGIAWFGIIGIASLTGFTALFRLKFIVKKPRQKNSLKWKTIITEQWGFSKWIVLAAFLNFIASQIQIFITAGILGLDSAGIFRALQNFTLPMMQVLAAISTLVLPSIALAFGNRDYKGMQKRSSFTSIILSIFAILYMIFLYIFAVPIESLFYANKYQEYTWLIPISGVIPVMTAIEINFSLIVRSLQRSIYHAILTFSMATAGILSALILIPRMKITGAAISLIITAIFSLGINTWFYRIWFTNIHTNPPT